MKTTTSDTLKVVLNLKTSQYALGINHEITILRKEIKYGDEAQTVAPISQDLNHNYNLHSVDEIYWYHWRFETIRSHKVTLLNTAYRLLRQSLEHLSMMISYRSFQKLLGLMKYL